MVTGEFELRGFPTEKRSQRERDYINFTYRYQRQKAKAERTAEKLLHAASH